MSYFDPEIYNLDNLHEIDREEAEYWRDEFLADLDGAPDTVCDDDTTLGKLRHGALRSGCFKYYCEIVLFL